MTNVQYDKGQSDCVEGFKALNEEIVLCNRPKGHKGKHWRWVGDRVMYFEEGYMENTVVTKRKGAPRF